MVYCYPRSVTAPNGRLTHMLMISTAISQSKMPAVIVVGGGEIALRKVRLVAEADAFITIVAKEFCADLIEMQDSNAKKGIHNLELITAPYQQHYIENNPDAVLVIASTNDPELNQYQSMLNRHICCLMWSMTPVTQL